MDHPENTESSDQPNSDDATAEEAPRRSFLVEVCAVSIGAILSLFSFLIGLVVFFDPVTRKKRSPLLFQGKDEQGSDGGEDDGFIRVASLDELPDDGVPRRFAVVSDQIDAWTFSPNQPIGAVWMSRKSGDQSVHVFHTTCPHLGCAVSYRASSQLVDSMFHCPCHNSSFDLNGNKVEIPGKENPSPRPLDSLKSRVDDDGSIHVQFRNFYTGIHEKKQKA